jgi:hypothetical protein
MKTSPKILFNDKKLCDLQLVPQTPECFTFKVYDDILLMNITFALYRSGEVWELMVMDDRICVEVMFDQYVFDRASNCFYTVKFFYSNSKS